MSTLALSRGLRPLSPDHQRTRLNAGILAFCRIKAGNWELLLAPNRSLRRFCLFSSRIACLTSPLPFQLFSAFFTCIAVASDVICYLFVPPMWIFFLGSTYVWVQFLWQTGEFHVFQTVLPR